jgi:hypothetical protein
MARSSQSEYRQENVSYYTYLTNDGEGCFKFELHYVEQGFVIDLAAKPKGVRVNSRAQIINHSGKPSVSLGEACQQAEVWAEAIWLETIKRNTRHQNTKPKRKSVSREPGSVASKKRMIAPVKNDTLPMVFTKESLAEIKSSVGSLKPETGGILFGYRNDYVVRKFVFDKEGSFSPGGYDPNVAYLNPFIKIEWDKNRYELIGFIHSHPRGVNRLSGDWGNGFGDLGYLKRIFEHIDGLDKFLVPVVYSRFDGQPFEMFPFIAWKNAVENYQEGTVEIESNETEK